MANTQTSMEKLQGSKSLREKGRSNHFRYDIYISDDYTKLEL